MSKRQFRAFVSYCHADRAFASDLQRRLEAYRLPKRLADRVEPLAGQARGRIGPVFRDRADLPATQDLSAAVREATTRYLGWSVHNHQVHNNQVHNQQ